MRYWLIKSEGNCYSIDDLKKDKVTSWTGIRNYQARNFMRDDMSIGDLVLFYHSLGTPENPSGIYGIAKVGSVSHPDMTQFEKEDMHYDPKASKEKPIWYCVDMKYISTFKTPVNLGMIKLDRNLEGMEVRRAGSRLSVQPVSEKHFIYIRDVLAK